jgi:endonuclease YncB( thermonuclease family)
MNRACLFSSSSNKKAQSTSRNIEERLRPHTWHTCNNFVPEIIEGKIIKCYDGDTVTIATILNDTVVRFNIRMLGYDCAEMRSKDVQEKRVAKWAKDFITNLIYDKMVKVTKNNGYDKYGRLLLELECNGDNINNIMLDEWGIVYHGGQKQKIDWSRWSVDGRDKLNQDIKSLVK